MARKPMPWFRFYVETFADRKIRRLTPAQRWAWAAILAAARESPEPGRLLVAEDCPLTVKELADHADVRLADARRAVDLAVEMGMVSIDQGVITVANWRKRQPESDDVTARTRTFRERSRERVGNVPGNGLGTNAFRARARGEETEEETEITTKGGERTEPSSSADATEPTCSRHPFADSPDPCAGCARVREWRDRNEAEAKQRVERQRSRSLLAERAAAKAASVPRPKETA